MTSRTFAISLAIAACVCGCLIWITDSRRQEMRTKCLTRFANLNKALVLYRSDYDGYSPCYTRFDFRAPEEKLAIYSKAATLDCPLGELRPGNLRLVGPAGTGLPATAAMWVFSSFGVEDTSVVASCIEHLRFPPRLKYLHSAPDPRHPSGGAFIVLLRNGTAKLVAFNTPMQAWNIYKKEFRTPESRPSSWTSFANLSTFKFEPSPPRFER